MRIIGLNGIPTYYQQELPILILLIILCQNSYANFVHYLNRNIMMA
jgi:hypothetical protein